MDRFETQFENLDVQSQVMENTMCNSSTLTTPQGQVDSLMQEVADEAGYGHIHLTFSFSQINVQIHLNGTHFVISFPHSANYLTPMQRITFDNIVV